MRTERKPYLLEAMVSRLRGHSSASGANLVKGEVDCLEQFERDARGPQAPDAARTWTQLRERYTAELAEASKRVRGEPAPGAELDLGSRVRRQEPVGGER